MTRDRARRHHGARLLPQRQVVAGNARRAHGLERIFRAQRLPTYLPDQVTRARSGFDPTVFTQVKSRQGATRSAAEHPDRSVTKPPGPRSASVRHPGVAYPDTQFPTDYADEFYKQMIPDLNLMLGPYTGPNPTFNHLATLAGTAVAR